MTSSASISTQSAAGRPSIRDDLAELLLDLVGELGRHRRDLARRAAASDHHMVGDGRLAGERDRDDLDRLVVVERLQDKAVQRLDVDRLGRTAAGAWTGSAKVTPSIGWTSAALASSEAAVPVGVERAQAGGGSRVGRQAKEDNRRCTPVRPVALPGSRGGRTAAASPSRAPRGQRHHSPGGESPQSAPSPPDLRQCLPLVELGHSVGAHQPDEAVVGVAPLRARASVSTV